METNDFKFKGNYIEKIKNILGRNMAWNRRVNW